MGLYFASAAQPEEVLVKDAPKLGQLVADTPGPLDHGHNLTSWPRATSYDELGPLTIRDLRIDRIESMSIAVVFICEGL